MKWGRAESEWPSEACLMSRQRHSKDFCVLKLLRSLFFFALPVLVSAKEEVGKESAAVG